MNDLNKYTKTELIQRINELEAELEVKNCSPDLSKESSIPLESFVQKANFPICHVDNSNGKIKYFNHRFFETFGYTHKEIPSLEEWWTLAYPDPNYREWVINNWTEAVNHSIENNTDITPDVYDVTCKDGSIRQIFISGITIGDDFIATFFDLSKQKKAEQELFEIGEQFRALVQNTEEIFFVIDKDGTFLLSEGKGLKALGLEAGQVVGQSVFELYKDYPEMLDAMQRALKGETVLHEVKVGEIYFRSWYTPYKNQDEKIIGLLGLSSNLSEQKEAEKRLLEQNRTLKAISDLFAQTIKLNSSEEVARLCLQIAIEITNSEYGSIAEVNPNNKFDTLAVSNPVYPLCREAEKNPSCLQDMEIRGIWREALIHDKGMIFNEPSKHKKSVGVPDGHPPLNCFLGVPFKHAKFNGLIGIANKPDGYDENDIQILQAISTAFAEVINSKRNEETLLTGEARFKSIYNSKITGVMFWNADGRVLDANKEFLNLLGYKKEDITIGELNWKDITPAEFAEQDVKLLEEIQKKGFFNPVEKEYIHKDGHRVPILLGAAVLPGNSLNGVAYVIDNSLKKQSEAKVIEQKLVLDRILEGTNAGTWDWNVETGAVVFNERWAEIMGKTLKELGPVDINTWIDNVHPEDLPYANEELNKHFNKESDYYDVIFRQPHKDDYWVWVNARGKVIEWTEDGKPLRMSGTHIDITERKEVETELQNYKDKLESIVADRTKELAEKNKELDDALKVFVGREKTIMELQEQINKLKLSK